MEKKDRKIETFKATIEGISYGGKVERRSTVLIKVGSKSISKRALQLGGLLVGLQILDGVLTYIGVTLYGNMMEGNYFLHVLMESYGAKPVLFFSKLLVVGVIFVLTGLAHKRKWIRPFILLLCVVYLMCAVIPWVFIISNHYAQGG
jgi:hypothetical protein